MDKALSHTRPVATKRRAFSLIEAAIVLGVVGLVIGGIWVAAKAVTENRKITATYSGMLMIQKNILQVYDQKPPPATATLDRSAGWQMGLFNGTEGFSYEDNSTATLQKTWTPLGNGKAVYIVIQYLQTGEINLHLHGNATSPTAHECIKLVSSISRANNLKSITIGMLQITSFPFMPTVAQCTATYGITFLFK